MTMVEVKTPLEIMDGVKKLLTAEELFKLGDIGPCELVEGELIMMSPTSGEHGEIVALITTALSNFARPNRLGHVLAGEAGTLIKRDPDTVRGVDVMFYAAGRLDSVDRRKYLPLPPDLAIEVVSPEDRWNDVELKVTEYLDAGVRLVWVVDPHTRTVRVYKPGWEMRRLAVGDTLDGGDVLPGFTMPVGDLFA
jgi:Uma2 family endonuclease